MEKLLKNTLLKPIMALIICFPFYIGYKTEDNIAYKPYIDNPLGIEKSFIVLCGILALLVLLPKYFTKNEKAKKLSLRLSALFSMCVVFGKSYECISSWGYVFSTFSAFVSAAMSFVSFTAIFYCGLSVLCNFILNYNKSEGDGYFKHFQQWCDCFLKQKSLLKLWLILMIAWLPYLIINYPAVIHADSGVMLGQYLSNNIDNHHPVVQTLIWGGFVKFFADNFNSWNLGVFLFAFIQFVYGSFIVALNFDYLNEKKFPSAIILLSLIIVGIMPTFARNATAICKDSNYTFFVLFIMWLIFKTCDCNTKIDKKQLYTLLPLWFAAIVLTCFARKTGIHICILTIPFVLFYIRKNKAFLIALAAVCLLGIGSYYAGEYIIESNGIENDDTQETFSIPFQQTARYIRDFEDDITYDERESINAVLDFDTLAERYEPERSDRVKETFKRESTPKEFSNYLGTWFTMLFKHPTAYIQATLNTVYGYFYPENIGYFKDLFYMSGCIDDSKIYPPKALGEFSYFVRDFNMDLRKVPVFGAFLSTGFYTWITLFVIAFFISFKKDKKYLIYCMPYILTILICVASPVNNTMRYALPFIFAAPILFCMTFSEKD